MKRRINIPFQIMFTTSILSCLYMFSFLVNFFDSTSTIVTKDDFGFIILALIFFVTLIILITIRVKIFFSNAEAKQAQHDSNETIDINHDSYGKRNKNGEEKILKRKKLTVAIIVCSVILNIFIHLLLTR